MKRSGDGHSVVAPAGLRAFLKGTAWDVAMIRSCRENVIAPGDRVAVVGMIETEKAPPRGSERAHAEGQRRVLKAVHGQQLLLSDDPLAMGLPEDSTSERKAAPAPTAETHDAFNATQSSALASAGDGAVGRFIGTVIPIGEPFKAALTMRECVLYECRVRCCGAVGERTVIRGRRMQDFLLDDGTGVARVSASADRVVVLTEAGRRGDEPSRLVGDEPLPGLTAFLAERHRQEDADMYFETLIAAGDRVAVVGMVGSEVDPQAFAGTAPYRHTAKRRVLSAEPDRPLLVSTDPEAMR